MKSIINDLIPPGDTTYEIILPFHKLRAMHKNKIWKLFILEHFEHI